ncbi:MAG: PEGA domain-containing protein [Ignavibacteria bacterium]|nr:PEGA domain-containing protein [Ignavibacteria bacterium]
MVNSAGVWICVLLFTAAMSVYGQDSLGSLRVEENALQLFNETDAMIKIYTELELSFECSTLPMNAENIHENSTGKQRVYFVLINPYQETISLNIIAKGYSPLLLQLKGLGAKRTWVYYIFARPHILSDVGNIFLSSDPPGAHISIRGQQPFPAQTPYYFKNQTAMGYWVTLTREGYKDTTFIMQVQRDTSLTMNVKMAPLKGMLHIFTSPENKIFVDGNECPECNSQPILLGEKNRAILVKKKYHKPFYKMVSLHNLHDTLWVRDGQELQPWIGVIAVATDPPGAAVFADGQYWGNTPVQKSVAAGKYRMMLSKPGYDTLVETVELLEEETFMLSRSLNVQSGLSIDSRPAGADVMINGKKFGQTPLHVSLPEGDYSIAIEKSGYKPEHLEKHVNSMEAFHYTAILNKLCRLIIKRNEGVELTINGRPAGTLDQEREFLLEAATYSITARLDTARLTKKITMNADEDNNVEFDFPRKEDGSSWISRLRCCTAPAGRGMYVSFQQAFRGSETRQGVDHMVQNMAGIGYRLQENNYELMADVSFFELSRSPNLISPVKEGSQTERFINMLFACRCGYVPVSFENGVSVSCGVFAQLAILRGDRGYSLPDIGYYANISCNVFSFLQLSAGYQNCVRKNIFINGINFMAAFQ